jgi:hypothetical protein
MKLRKAPFMSRSSHSKNSFYLSKIQARLKALFCTRRAAKSYTGGLYLIREALENPGCNCLFIALLDKLLMASSGKISLETLDKENNSI